MCFDRPTSILCRLGPDTNMSVIHFFSGERENVSGRMKSWRMRHDELHTNAADTEGRPPDFRRPYKPAPPGHASAIFIAGRRRHTAQEAAPPTELMPPPAQGFRMPRNPIVRGRGLPRFSRPAVSRGKKRLYTAIYLSGLQEYLVQVSVAAQLQFRNLRNQPLHLAGLAFIRLRYGKVCAIRYRSRRLRRLAVVVPVGRLQNVAVVLSNPSISSYSPPELYVPFTACD